MVDNFKLLPQYASFLLTEKLSHIVTLYLERALHTGNSLQEQSNNSDNEHNSDSEQIADFLQHSYVELLRCLAAEKGKEYILNSIHLWKNSQLPYFTRDMAGISHLVASINIRKYTLIRLLREYSSDLDIREQIVYELVEYYSFYFIKLIEAFGEIQQEKLLQQMELSQSIINHCVDGISAFDLNWNITEWNPAMEKINHRRKEEVLGKNFYDFFPAYEGSEEAIAAKKVFEGQSVYLTDRQYKVGSGWYEAHMVPLHNDRKEVTGILSITHDITERKNSELKIKEDQHFIQSLADTSPDVITVYDLEKGANIYSSKEIYEILGYSQQELTALVEKGVQGLVEVIHPEDLPLILAFLESYKTYTGGKARDLEYRIKDNKGNYRWIMDRYNVFKKSDYGLPVQIIGVARDNTARKIAEEELKEANFKLHETNEELLRTEELLKEANNELEERVQLRTAELIDKNIQLASINADLENFVYTASHDLKAPILNVEGLLRAMERQLSSEIRQSKGIQQIYELLYGSVARFKNTIRDLTEVARTNKENPEDVDIIHLEEVIKEVQQDLQPQIQETGAKIDVKLNCTGIRFSRKNLKSILYNLLSNAIKYHAAEREPLVHIRCEKENEFLVLSVEDNGLGMDMRQEDKIFALFKRLHNHVEGTGIGLYIVKRIIDNAAGKIEVESRVGVGSTFRVYFRN